MSQGEKDSPNTSSYEAWEASMLKEYHAKARQQPSRTEPYTIHRVPESIRKVDEGAYEPKMVSIGPYHRSNPKLQAMEDRKWQSLGGVLRRFPETRLSDYLKEMEELEVQVRGFYSENEEINRIGSKEFVEMMLLDSCFILELLLLDAEGKNTAGKVDNPIYSTNSTTPIICRDMLLLENQLPFLVLQHLFQFVGGSNICSLVELAIRFFYHVMPLKIKVARVDPFDHLLDLFHWYVLPENSPHSRLTMEKVHKQRLPPPPIPSATEIQYPGIRLREKWGASSILDVKFRHGVLEIPRLSINYSTDSIFRNLIAWEQCYPASGNYFTSYATFMDCLIDTPQDVVVLKNSGIIRHWFRTDEEVALLFNKLCIGITVNPASDSSFLYGLSCAVADFRMGRWAKWRDALMRNYFRNPWDFINYQFTAMTIIFTIVQTALAVVSLKRSS